MAMEKPDGKRISNLHSQPSAKSVLPKIDEDDEDQGEMMSPKHKRIDPPKVLTLGIEPISSNNNDGWPTKNDSQFENPRFSNNISQFGNAQVPTEVLENSADWKLKEKV
jgi:hypothetical protein